MGKDEAGNAIMWLFFMICVAPSDLMRRTLFSKATFLIYALTPYSNMLCILITIISFRYCAWYHWKVYMLVRHGYNVYRVWYHRSRALLVPQAVAQVIDGNSTPIRVEWKKWLWESWIFPGVFWNSSKVGQGWILPRKDNFCDLSWPNM